jgi:hypothetical protein
MESYDTLRYKINQLETTLISTFYQKNDAGKEFVQKHIQKTSQDKSPERFLIFCIKIIHQYVYGKYLFYSL